MRMFLQAVLILVTGSPTRLFVPALRGTRSVAVPQVQQLPAMQWMRVSTVQMGEDVKGRKDWKFSKGINDYGKEQTYMTLGAKEGGKKYAFDPFNAEGNELAEAIWDDAYLIFLFAPFVFAAIYVLTGQGE
jgi:hypothetical protein